MGSRIDPLQLFGDEASQVINRHIVAHEFPVDKCPLQQLPSPVQPVLASANGKSTSVTHVCVISGQLISDWPGWLQQLGNHPVATKYHQKVAKTGTQIIMCSQSCGVTVTAWEMEIEKLTDTILVKLIGREVASGHPMCKVRQSARVSANGSLGISASVKKCVVCSNMNGK